MPGINVMTWNSRGESPAKAAFIQNLILNNPVVPGWQPDVIFIQEAVIGGGGQIFAMLAGLGAQPGGAIYSNHAPALLQTQGDGLICMLSNNATAIANNFALVDLPNDPGTNAFINTLPANSRPTARNEVAAMRMPGSIRFTFAARTIEAMTWHTPLGPGQLLHGNVAAVNYDAFAFLFTSNYYTANLDNPGLGGLGLVSGDLNVVNLNANTGIPQMATLFPGWVGFSNNLDHSIGVDNGGAVAFNNAGFFPSNGLSDHAVLVGQITWP